MNSTLEAAGKWRKLAGFTFVAIAFVFLAIFLSANLKELQQHGIFTILTPPEKLTINTVNKYLELKARQAI